MTQYKEIKEIWGERIIRIPNPHDMWGDTVRDWPAAARRAFEENPQARYAYIDGTMDQTIFARWGESVVWGLWNGKRWRADRWRYTGEQGWERRARQGRHAFSV